MQQPAPPKWTTVVSIESARKAARRGSKLCTGFHPIERIGEIFDAYRDEAARVGWKVGPDHLAIRRNITLARDQGEAEESARTALRLYRQALTHDPRYTDSPVPDAPGPTHGFSVGEDEFIAGTGERVAEQIIAQCRRVGAGHFLSTVDRSAPPEKRMATFELYARHVIPVLRQAGGLSHADRRRGRSQTHRRSASACRRRLAGRGGNCGAPLRRRQSRRA